MGGVGRERAAVGERTGEPAAAEVQNGVAARKPEPETGCHPPDDWLERDQDQHQYIGNRGDPYELYCAVQQVEHRTTRVGSPESNGMVERFNRTLKEEFFSVAYRKRLYESVEALQADLDSFLSFYNERRAHHGYRTFGRTLLQTFTEHHRAAEAPQAA